MLLALTPLVQAQNIPPEHLTIKTEDNPFGVIDFWFGLAKTVTFRELQGSVFEGRCFSPDGDFFKVREAIYLAALTSPESDNRGPAFDGSANKVALLTTSRHVGPVKNEMLDSMKSNWGFYKDWLKLDSLAEGSQENISFSIRRWGPYLVGQMKNREEARCSDFVVSKESCQGLTIPKGTTVATCYFFKELN